MNQYLQFLTKMNQRGWQTALRQSVPLRISPLFMTHYQRLPDDYKEFLKNIRICKNAEKQIWFLCEADYLQSAQEGFGWNELEKISLEGASEDPRWVSAIETFWGQYVPIILSTVNQYEYYAIELASGAIVYGEGPEFEAVMEIASDFTEFLTRLSENELFFS